MSTLIFNKIFIFSSSEKKARVFEFSAGKNIITSSPQNGTKRGKSVVMKSLYHAMGADCYFDSKWNDSDKIYILEFSFENDIYYVYRCNQLFKIFDGNKELLFKTVHRNDLGKFLASFLNFGVQLPNRKDDKLEVTPPAYNYLLNFIDQDRIQGTTFASFNNLTQYQDYKENTLYYHFGAFDENYYQIIKELEKIKEQLLQLSRQLEIANEMFIKIVQNIRGVSYTQSLDLLKKDLERTKADYVRITSSLSKIRNKLIELRNEKADLEASLYSLKVFNKENEKQINKLKTHTCPLCESVLENTLSLRIKKYNTADDIILLSNNMQVALDDVERKIEKSEKEYSKWLVELKKYEQVLSDKHGKIDDVLAHKGYIEIKDKVTEEIAGFKETVENLQKAEKELKREEKEYINIKNAINDRYYELMLRDKYFFALEEIDENNFRNIKKTFMAGGSNKPIATVIWYMNLLKLKYEFNPDAVKFPIVFDSPNNAETDEKKKSELYSYIVENTTAGEQLIVSGIGYDNNQTFGVSFDKVIFLDNSKYQLLCEEDYNKYKDILHDLCTK